MAEIDLVEITETSGEPVKLGIHLDLHGRKLDIVGHSWTTEVWFFNSGRPVFGQMSCQASEFGKARKMNGVGKAGDKSALRTSVSGFYKEPTLNDSWNATLRYTAQKCWEFQFQFSGVKIGSSWTNHLIVVICGHVLSHCIPMIVGFTIYYPLYIPQ